ncbi:MAG: ADP-ribosylation factor-like protein [Promethearchaeota archaeon]
MESHTIFNYPQEVVKRKDRIVKLVLKNYKYDENQEKNSLKKKTHQIEKPIHHNIDPYIISTVCVDGMAIIGVLFQKEDNPIDYDDMFLELMHELINRGSWFSFKDDLEIENLLITIFVDFRRYGEEVMKEIQLAGIKKKSSILKIFLFGIEEVGKTSLLRRLKTGEYEDNYFQPTRKFNIEYIQDDEMGLLAFWDMPGQLLFRRKWLAGSQDSNIIVYMIDISNQIRFEESKKELHSIINRYELSNIPLLILGNKVDLVNQLSENDDITINQHLVRLKHEIFDYFELEMVNNRKWDFLFTSVKTNYNIEEFYELLVDLLQR